MQKYSRKLAALAAAASLALTGTLAGCSSAESDHKIRIGIKVDQPGLGYQDGNTYTGFDVEVARYVAGKLGYSEEQIEFVESPAANRENMLNTGQVDMIFATYSISDSRKKTVDFAGPYYASSQAILVKADNQDIAGVDTLTGDLTFHANGTVASTWDQVAAFRGVSEGDVTRCAIPRREPLAVEHEHFRDAILGKGNEHVSMEEGLNALKVVEGILASAASGQAVHF